MGEIYLVEVSEQVEAQRGLKLTLGDAGWWLRLVASFVLIGWFAAVAWGMLGSFDLIDLSRKLLTFAPNAPLSHIFAVPQWDALVAHALLLLVATWLTVLVGAIGVGAGRLLGLCLGDEPPLLGIGLAGALGYAVVCLLFTLLTLAGLLYDWLVWTLTIAASLGTLLWLARPRLLVPWWRRDALGAALGRTLGEARHPGRNFVPLVLLLATALSALLALATALAPPVLYDTMLYHLALPRQYVAHHGFVPVYSEMVIMFAEGMEFIYTWPLSLFGGDNWAAGSVAGLLHWWMGILTAMGVYGFCRALGLSGRVGLLAAATFLAQPLVNREIGTAYVDVGTAFFTLFCLYALYRWWQSERTGWLTAAALLAGTAAAVKVFGTPLILVTMVVVVGKWWIKRIGRDKSRPYAADDVGAQFIAPDTSPSEGNRLIEPGRDKSRPYAADDVGAQFIAPIASPSEGNRLIEPGRDKSRPYAADDVGAQFIAPDTSSNEGNGIIEPGRDKSRPYAADDVGAQFIAPDASPSEGNRLIEPGRDKSRPYAADDVGAQFIAPIAAPTATPVRLGKYLRLAAVTGLIGGLTACYSYITSWIVLGNPFWPELNNIFHGWSSPIADANYKQLVSYLHSVDQGPMNFSLGGMLKYLFWDLWMDQASPIAGGISVPRTVPVTTALLPVALLLGGWAIVKMVRRQQPVKQGQDGGNVRAQFIAPHPALWWGFGYALVFTVLWFLVQGQRRYILFTLPLVAAGLGWVYERLRAKLPLAGLGFSLFLVVLMYVATLSNLAFDNRAFPNVYGFVDDRFYILEGATIRLGEGGQTMLYLNRVAPPDQTVLITELTAPLYYLGRDYVMSNPGWDDFLYYGTLKTAGDFLVRLNHYNVSYLVDVREQKYLAPLMQQGMWQGRDKYMHLVYTQGNWYTYQRDVPPPATGLKLGPEAGRVGVVGFGGGVPPDLNAINLDGLDRLKLDTLRGLNTIVVKRSLPPSVAHTYLDVLAVYAPDA
ncbi:MAG: hypothetical protein DLM69_04895, partial [Candidatus Chloroheliales bacterium]